MITSSKPFSLTPQGTQAEGSSMNLAKQFVDAWHNGMPNPDRGINPLTGKPFKPRLPRKTTSASALARALDPKVCIIKNLFQQGARYDFSDSSTASTSSRGIHFKITYLGGPI